MNFLPLTLSDMPKISEFLKDVTHRACDCTLGGIFIWRDYFGTSYAIEDDTLIFRVGDGHDRVYTYPIGKCSDHLLEKIIDEFGSVPFYLCSREDMLLFKQKYPTSEIVENRDAFDYLYDYEGLATFKGKKYSGQRNHVNKFNRLYENHSFEELCEANIPACRRFFEEFISFREVTDATNAEAEKIREIFDNYDFYKENGFFGGLLKIEERVVGFSVATVLGDTMFVHVEKADITVDGAYQKLVCSFAEHFRRDGVVYINREDDAGSEGLRKSKLSYQPIELLPKYSATFA